MLQITEVRVKLMERPDDRLRAFCSITFDNAFVIRDLKVIEGGSGPFVAMPSRKLNFHCTRCGGKNSVGVSFCNDCGAAVRASERDASSASRENVYTDVAHPINSECRELIQRHVVKAYETELAKAGSANKGSRVDKTNPSPPQTRFDRSVEPANGSSQIEKTNPKRSGLDENSVNGLGSKPK